MSWNSLGRVFRLSTWGESHGPEIGCMIDGTPPGIPLAVDHIQPWLDRRKPGGPLVSQRRETDRVRICSGVFAGLTTGTPVCLTITNQDARSRDYDAIADRYRPGHADWTYDMKYGLRDWRGSGRASARETAMRVAGGAVARRVLSALYGDGLAISGALVELGGIAVREGLPRDQETLDTGGLSCPDPEVAGRWTEVLMQARKAGSSLGAIMEIRASGVPAGLGAPVYGKLDADLAAAMMGINAVKGVEIGAGFAAARLRGEENADPMFADDHGRVHFAGNHAGGVLGGISTGQEIVVRAALKPTSSISVPVASIDRGRNPVQVRTGGRHDPCVGIRAVPVGEAMMALVLADHALLHRGQTGRDGPSLSFAPDAAR